MSFQKLTGALEKMGVSRVEALLVDFFRQNDEATTQDVVEATGLRQPEVSVGVRRLSQRGWLECRPLPREGKGRPMNHYRCTAKPEAIRAHYERRGREHISAYEKALKEATSALQAEGPLEARYA